MFNAIGWENGREGTECAICCEEFSSFSRWEYKCGVEDCGLKVCSKCKLDQDSVPWCLYFVKEEYVREHGWEMPSDLSTFLASIGRPNSEEEIREKELEAERQAELETHWDYQMRNFRFEEFELGSWNDDVSYSQRRLFELFCACGGGKTGRISVADFHRAMAGKRKDDLRPLLAPDRVGDFDWQSIVSNMDKNHDGDVDFQEFQDAVKSANWARVNAGCDRETEARRAKKEKEAAAQAPKYQYDWQNPANLDPENW